MYLIHWPTWNLGLIHLDVEDVDFADNSQFPGVVVDGFIQFQRRIRQDLPTDISLLLESENKHS